MTEMVGRGAWGRAGGSGPASRWRSISHQGSRLLGEPRRVAPVVPLMLRRLALLGAALAALAPLAASVK